jgi:hypothetical protein
LRNRWNSCEILSPSIERGRPDREIPRHAGSECRSGVRGGLVRRPASGLGDEFLSELETAYELIQANPNLIPRMERYDGPHVFRRCLLRRFPYHVVFACSDEEMVVIAISHYRRRPFYWLQRM